MPATCPGSNELLDGLDEATPTRELFDLLVREYGRSEASRRWMALFGASDGAET